MERTGGGKSTGRALTQSHQDRIDGIDHMVGAQRVAAKDQHMDITQRLYEEEAKKAQQEAIRERWVSC